MNGDAAASLKRLKRLKPSAISSNFKRSPIGTILATRRSARAGVQEGEIILYFQGGKSWRLTRRLEPAESSLRVRRYVRAARAWATVTPIALDRHTNAVNKGNQAMQRDMAECIAVACTHIGLPRPSAVVPDRHSAIRGCPSARVSRRSPPWEQWSRPESLHDRPLTHATILFDQPVCGPIALGFGRFFGFGLCLPLE